MEFSFSVALIFVGKMCATLSESACKKLENKQNKNWKNLFLCIYLIKRDWLLHDLHGLFDNYTL